MVNSISGILITTFLILIVVMVIYLYLRKDAKTRNSEGREK